MLFSPFNYQILWEDLGSHNTSLEKITSGIPKLPRNKYHNRRIKYKVLLLNLCVDSALPAILSGSRRVQIGKSQKKFFYDTSRQRVLYFCIAIVAHFFFVHCITIYCYWTYQRMGFNYFFLYLRLLLRELY